MIDALTTCKKTRKLAASSLKTALEKLLSKKNPISEVNLRDAWLFELRKHKEIFPNGWYDPPPHGIIVLFATDDNPSRTHFQSVRPQEFWPRNDIFLDRKKGIILLYTSPVDKNSGIIGDFELTLYLGKNKELQKYIKTCLTLNYEISHHAEIGMTFSQLTIFGQKIYKKYGLMNDVLSTTNPDGLNIIGHTIPFSHETMKAKEKKLLKENVDWKTICNLISKKRIFVDMKKQFSIQKNLAFTIEPRAIIKNKPYFPLVMFHVITMFHKNGKKELLTGFNDIFRLVGMDYML